MGLRNASENFIVLVAMLSLEETQEHLFIKKIVQKVLNLLHVCQYSYKFFNFSNLIINILILYQSNPFGQFQSKFVDVDIDNHTSRSVLM